MPKSFLIILLSSIVFFISIIKNKEFSVINLKGLIPLILYLVLNTIFVSKLPMRSFQSLIYFFTFIFLIPQDWDYRKEKFNLILNIVATIISFYAIFQFFGIDPFFVKSDITDYEALNGVFSTLGNKNYLAEFLATVVIFNLCRGYDKVWNLFYISVVFMILTKTTIFFLVVYLIYYLFRHVKNKKKFFKSSLIVILLIIIAYTITQKNETWQVQKSFDFNIKNSFTQRIFIWEATISVIKEYFLFGTGIGLFEEAFLYYQGENVFDYDYNYFCDARYAHNEVLHVMAELGLVGSIIILLYFRPFIKYLYRSKYRPLLFYLIFQSMFSFPLRLPSIFIVLFFIFNQAVKDKELETDPVRNDIIKKIIGIYTVFMFALYITLYFITGIYMKLGLRSDNLTEKKYYFEKATRINPGWYLPYYNAALYYYNRNQYMESIQYLTRTLDYSRRPLIFFYRGLNFIGLGEYELAIRDLEKFVQFYPVSYKAYYNLYMLYSQKDDQKSLEKAQYYYEMYETLFNAVENPQN